MKPSDNEVNKLKISSEKLEELLIKYSSTIRAICHKFYLVGGTADDLFQEGMIGLLEACKNYNGTDFDGDDFKKFATVCIKRQIYDAIKVANKKSNTPLNTYLPIEKKAIDDDREYERNDILNIAEEYNPEDLFLDREEHFEKLNLVKSKLSKFENIVLDLYLSGEKQSEIAKTLAKDVKSIDNTIQRIKKKLR